MDNTNIAPVDHGVLSATGNVAAGAAGGFVKSGLKGYGITAIACTVLGGLVGAAIVAGFSISAPIWIGALAGAVLGFGPVGMLAGGASAAVGTYTGAGHAYHKVKLEKGASNVMQAQVEAYKAEAQAQAIAAANDNKYNLAPQGATVNQAGTIINASQAENHGRIDGQQLQRA